MNVIDFLKNKVFRFLKLTKLNGDPNSERLTYISDDEAIRIQNDHNTILDAAQNAGFKSSNAERAGLLNLYAVHGLDKMLNAINECMKHSAPNLAYLEAVLNGTGKKKTDARDVHNYDQRDYSNAQSEAIKRMMSDDWGDEKEGAK